MNNKNDQENCKEFVFEGKLNFVRFLGIIMIWTLAAMWFGTFLTGCVTTASTDKPEAVRLVDSAGQPLQVCDSYFTAAEKGLHDSGFKLESRLRHWESKEELAKQTGNPRIIISRMHSHDTLATLYAMPEELMAATEAYVPDPKKSMYKILGKCQHGSRVYGVMLQLSLYGGPSV